MSTILREALEKSLRAMKRVNTESTPAGRFCHEIDNDIDHDVYEAIKTAEAALSSEGESGEPVGWRAKLGYARHWTFLSSRPEEVGGWHSIEPLYAAPSQVSGECYECGTPLPADRVCSTCNPAALSAEGQQEPVGYLQVTRKGSRTFSEEPLRAYEKEHGWTEIPLFDAPSLPVVGEEQVAEQQAARWPQPGDKMRFLGENGYPADLERALKVFAVGQELTVKGCRVGGWMHYVSFEGHEGQFNGVMFERIPPDSDVPQSENDLSRGSEADGGHPNSQSPQESGDREGYDAREQIATSVATFLEDNGFDPLCMSWKEGGYEIADLILPILPDNVAELARYKSGYYAILKRYSDFAEQVARLTGKDPRLPERSSPTPSSIRERNNG